MAPAGYLNNGDLCSVSRTRSIQNFPDFGWQTPATTLPAAFIIEQSPSFRLGFSSDDRCVKLPDSLGIRGEIVPDHLSKDKLTEGSEELPLEVSVIDSDS